MAKPDHVIDKRMVNALFKGAETSGAANRLLGGAGKAGVSIVEKMMGGLWVGGNAYLKPQTIEFHPNALNKIFHKGGAGMGVVLELSEVIAVTHRFGVATKIIDIEAPDVTLSIRGYNMKSFADAIEAARIAASDPGP
ncbi:MAG: hypothetical protein AAF768_11790 [Pseudomonadota bacterium]